MEIFKVTGEWSVQSKELKKRYSELTEADLKFEVGKEEDLLDRLRIRLNKKRDEVIRILQQTTR